MDRAFRFPGGPSYPLPGPALSVPRLKADLLGSCGVFCVTFSKPKTLAVLITCDHPAFAPTLLFAGSINQRQLPPPGFGPPTYDSPRPFRPGDGTASDSCAVLVFLLALTRFFLYTPQRSAI